MTFSDDFKINVNKLNADEAILPLIEITHPFISETIRIVNDNVKVISNGETYLPLGFEIKKADDIKGELPKVTITFPNVGRILTKWVDASGGGRNAEFKVKLIRRSNPDVIEEEITLGVSNVIVSMMSVQFNLIIQNNLVKRGIRYFFDKNRSPGLF